ncbi:hypothetical protein Mapa_008033 [Marchantia paleacea]|nr:hypothetical protein Mapa_008033 [Marchantia paleacea]
MDGLGPALMLLFPVLAVMIRAWEYLLEVVFLLSIIIASSSARELLYILHWPLSLFLFLRLLVTIYIFFFFGLRCTSV